MKLHYKGVVDPKPGTVMGPGLNKKFWVVTGSVYDTETKTTTVELEENE